MSAFSSSRLLPIREPRPEHERIDALIGRVVERFGVDRSLVGVVRSPLRICPLGAHIDHQLGVVTGMAIDRSLLLAFAAVDDDQVAVESLNFSGETHFRLSEIPPARPGDWGNYLRGAARALRERCAIGQGLVGVLESEMPVGGLSSSAAAVIAYLLALEAVNDRGVEPGQNIELVTATEHDYVGLNNGILDQATILFSRSGALTCIDCQSLTIDRIPGAPGCDFEILVVYSGLSHALVTTGYNARVAECQEAAARLLTFSGVPVPAEPRLRHVPPPLFAEYGRRLPALLQRRAAHFFGEMERVARGREAWQTGDLSELGRLMTASGASSIALYECGSPQLITLYEILADTPGVYGTRFSGAGFRGSCLALVDPQARAAVAEAVQRRYPAQHPDERARYSLHFCRPADAAGLVTGSV